MRQGGQSPPRQVYFYLTTTSPENKHNRSFLGFQPPLWQPPSDNPSSDNHQPRKRAVFRVSLVSWQPTPENEHNRSFLGIHLFPDNKQPRERARLLVFGVSTPSLTTTNPENEHDRSFSGFQLPLWQPPTLRTSMIARFRGLACSWQPPAPRTSTTARFRCKYINIICNST